MPSIPPSSRPNSAPPPPGVPLARGSVLHGFRAALLDLHGEGALEVLAAALPIATRVATVETMVLPFEWVVLDHVVAWHEALWAGPCRSDEVALAKLVSRSIELGFGKFKSAFFAGVTPERLVNRAPELWRWQHSHGDLSVTVEGATGVVLLRDHPYVDHATSRRVTAESYRQIVLLAGATDVRAAWGDRPSTGTSRGRELVVQLSWRPLPPPP